MLFKQANNSVLSVPCVGDGDGELPFKQANNIVSIVVCDRRVYKRRDCLPLRGDNVPRRRGDKDPAKPSRMKCLAWVFSHVDNSVSIGKIPYIGQIMI